MTLQEVENLMFNSTRDDWKSCSVAGVYVLTFIHNISIQLRQEENDELERFSEPWANSFPDRNAYRDIYVLYFNSSPITKYFFVSVDGGRASLPIPKSQENLVVTSQMYNLGRVVNSNEHDYEAYFQRAKLKIEENMTI